MSITKNDLKLSIEKLDRNIKFFNDVSAHFASQGSPNTVLNAQSVQSIIKDLVGVQSRLRKGLEVNGSTASVPIHPGVEEDTPTEDG